MKNDPDQEMRELLRSADRRVSLQPSEWASRVGRRSSQKQQLVTRVASCCICIALAGLITSLWLGKAPSPELPLDSLNSQVAIVPGINGLSPQSIEPQLPNQASRVSLTDKTAGELDARLERSKRELAFLKRQLDQQKELLLAEEISRKPFDLSHISFVAF